jgi:hypothetical protein
MKTVEKGRYGSTILDLVANSHIAVFLRAPTLATLDTGLVVITWQRR